MLARTISALRRQVALIRWQAARTSERWHRTILCYIFRVSPVLVSSPLFPSCVQQADVAEKVTITILDP